ncbi:NAD(P)-dependent oxidoreductase [Cohnella pontilimi]|uniref:NAD(P)-dependent oxidoreductase n=1 Tax=Cohnella pontilimi TaxID=2564100 RepID=A0A4U0FDI6_9BACL|nr:NAD(P)-dependent oxidoreductase [Cohnella pontilimi]TJY42895.1 NAD(P)-dependent oxidoreductase [Cohnella pontilimi]
MGKKAIGFIGLGAMGLPMAKNLLRKGFELHVAVHSNPGPIEELKQSGAHSHSTLSGVVAGCDILITVLPQDAEMEKVLLSPEVLEGLRPGCLLIEMTSGSPGMMKKIHAAYQKNGISVLDAPVSGGTMGAEKGTLTVMAGGAPEVLESCRPVLEAMAEKIYRVGPVGTGKAIKAINQMLAGVHMIAAAEAVALAEKLDIDLEMMEQVIGNSSGASWMLLNKLNSMSKRDFTPGFKHRLMKKDVQIAVGEGSDLSLPLASLALQLYKMTEKEYGDQDFSAISKSILT